MAAIGERRRRLFGATVEAPDDEPWPYHNSRGLRQGLQARLFGIHERGMDPDIEPISQQEWQSFYTRTVARCDALANQSEYSGRFKNSRGFVWHQGQVSTEEDAMAGVILGGDARDSPAVEERLALLREIMEA